jgi:hypothetical protein
MTISATTYWTIFWIVIALIVGIAYLISRKKNNKSIQGVGIIIAVVLIVVNKWIFPNVYEVSACGRVSKEILLYPKIDESGIQLSLGKHCYLLNKSNEQLYIETIVYGNVNTYKQPEKMINEEIPAGKGKEYNVVTLDYFFEAQDKSIRTKQDGELKYRVGCDE